MDEKDQLLMWNIDSRMQLGSYVQEKEKIWFNENFDAMMNQMESNYNHWKYHTSKINIKKP